MLAKPLDDLANRRFVPLAFVKRPDGGSDEECEQLVAEQETPRPQTVRTWLAHLGHLLVAASLHGVRRFFISPRLGACAAIPPGLTDAHMRRTVPVAPAAIASEPTRRRVEWQFGTRRGRFHEERREITCNQACRRLTAMRARGRANRR